MTDNGEPDNPAQVHLNLFASGCGHHAAAWRAADSDVDRLGDISWWESLAQTAERGRLDAVFSPTVRRPAPRRSPPARPGSSSR